MVPNTSARSSGRRRHPGSALGVRDRSLELRRAAADAWARAFADSHNDPCTYDADAEPERQHITVTYTTAVGLTYTRCNCQSAPQQYASSDGNADSAEYRLSRTERTTEMSEQAIEGTPIAGELPTDTPTRCSYCGKPFPVWDEQLGEPYRFGVYGAHGYPYLCCSNECLSLAIGDEPAED